MKPEPECEVTVRDADGTPWTMTVRARSLYRAVLAYRCNQISGQGHDRAFPKLERSTEVEVRPKDGRVLRTTYGRVQDAANKYAERFGGGRAS